MNEKFKKNLTKQNIISIAILVFGTIFSFLIFGSKDLQSQEDPVQETPTALVKTVIAGDDETKVAILEKTAIFSSSKEADVVAEYSGRVTSISFEIGTYVKEGQVLGYFDQSRQENSPKIALESAGASLEVARKNLEETEKLNKESLELAKNARKVAELQLEQEKNIPDNSDEIKIAQRNLENAKDIEDQAERQVEVALNNARLQVSQSLANVENSKIAYQKTVLKAPVSGIVTSKAVEQDQYVSAGTRIAHVTGSGKLQTTISLSNSQVERIKSGDEVKIIFGGEEHEGEIVSFSPVANSQNERFDVLIKSVKDLSGEANRSGKVALRLNLGQSGENSFFIPLEAVNIGQKKTVVFVVVDGQAVGREVQTNELVGSQIEIVQGISAGDEIIVENARNIQQGQKVKLNR